MKLNWVLLMGMSAFSLSAVLAHAGEIVSLNCKSTEISTRYTQFSVLLELGGVKSETLRVSFPDLISDFGGDEVVDQRNQVRVQTSEGMLTFRSYLRNPRTGSDVADLFFVFVEDRDEGGYSAIASITSSGYIGSNTFKCEVK